MRWCGREHEVSDDRYGWVQGGDECEVAWTMSEFDVEDLGWFEYPSNCYKPAVALAEEAWRNRYCGAFAGHRWLYLLFDPMTRLTKIGIASGLYYRHHMIQDDHGICIELLAAQFIENAEQAEALLHEVFKQYQRRNSFVRRGSRSRSNGDSEWFAFRDDQRKDLRRAWLLRDESFIESCKLIAAPLPTRYDGDLVAIQDEFMHPYYVGDGMYELAATHKVVSNSYVIDWLKRNNERHSQKIAR